MFFHTHAWPSWLIQALVWPLIILFIAPVSFVRQTNPEAENEGFEFVRYLSESDIATFRHRTITYGFACWFPYHIGPITGHHWRIEITFTNGSMQSFGGDTAYPLTWNHMYTAFYDLTGESILLQRSEQN